MTQSATHHWLSIDCWTCQLRSDKNSYRRPCRVGRTVGDAPANVCLWRPAAWTNTPKRREKNLIVRSGISEAETTNNKRLRSTFCIEATDTKHRAASLRQQSFLFHCVNVQTERSDIGRMAPHPRGKQPTTWPQIRYDSELTGAYSKLLLQLMVGCNSHFSLGLTDSDTSKCYNSSYMYTLLMFYCFIYVWC